MADLTVSSAVDTFMQAADRPGLWVALGTTNDAPNILDAFVIDTTKRLNRKSVSANQTFTFSGAPVANTWFGLWIQNTDADFAKTITIPNSLSIARNAATTTVTLPPGRPAGFYNGYLFLEWFYDGTFYYLQGDWNGVILATGQFTSLLCPDAGPGLAGADFSTFGGQFAGANFPSPGQGACYGFNAGNDPGGYAGVFLGFRAGQAGGGTTAVVIGHSAAKDADKTGTGNVILGGHTAEDAAILNGAIILGYQGFNGSEGETTFSVIIGDRCAGGLTTANKCVFIGAKMGESRDNTLHIGVADAVGGTPPLIYGEFDNQKFTVNGEGLFGRSVTNDTAAASAALEVKSTSRGFLPPRMTVTQANAISSPATGLQVIITDSLTALAVLGIGAALTGGGSNAVPAYYNGSAFVSY